MKTGPRLTRLLRLVPYLVAHQGVTTAEAATAFGVTPQQIIRDIEVLQFCGLPGGYYDDLFDVNIDVVREEGIIFFANADVLARPLRLRPAEAASLMAALRLVVEMTESSDAASALNKLAAAFGQQGQVSVAVAEAGDRENREALTRAIKRRRCVRLRYWTPGRDGASTAVVEPAKLRLVDGFTYLDAWSRPREDWRSYRLDRIEAVEPLDDPMAQRGEPPAAWFEDAPASLTLTVRPGARWITEYFPATAVGTVPEGLAVTFPVASPEWAASLVLRLGDAVVSVSDEDVARLARERAAAALALYR